MTRRRPLLAALAGAALLPHGAVAAIPAAVLERERRRILAEYGGVYADPATGAYVSRVADTLGPRAGGRFPVTILDSPILNAEALPDGSLFLARGLLGLMADEAELAGLLGHEEAHVALGHAERFAAAVGGDDLLAPLGAGSALARLRQQQEAAADRFAVDLLARAGYATDALARLAARQERAAALLSPAGPADPLHAAAADRLAALAGTNADGNRGAESFRAATEGLRWGEAPGQPAIRGDRVIDPGSGLAWAVPPGFRIRLLYARIVATGPGETAILADKVEQPGQLPPLLYLTRVWGRALALGPARDIAVAGRPAALAAARVPGAQGPRDTVMLAIAVTAERLDRFTLVLPAGGTPPLDIDGFLAAFRPLTPADRMLLAARRIAFRRVTDTGGGIEGLMVPDPDAGAWFAILNDLPDGASPPPGTIAKLVVA
jgi:predicted Zn-dependent protease